MSSVKAVTDDLHMVAKIASFYPLTDTAKKEIATAVCAALEEVGKRHNFLLWRVSVETKENSND